MRRSADERRSEILRAAVALFEQNGFDATSVEEITAKAKISKGLAYHYFKSKDEILLALIGLRLAELDDLTRRLRAEPSAERRLQILIDQLLDDVISGEKRQRFLITTFLQPQNNKLVQKAMKVSPERFESLQQEEIRLLADLGFKDAEAELPLFRAGMQGMAFLYLLNPAAFPLRQVAAQFVLKYSKKQEQT
ncbi:MAG: TetR/AcrR family transcriptional regulator [Spirochaetes bacterium]|nr:TetR/AcrR family transcriptional regulator [Spirochaetota bacterium]MBX3720635.1 TetR/AcrR family transcriptional regulator [Turneriella sp.]